MLFLAIKASQGSVCVCRVYVRTDAHALCVCLYVSMDAYAFVCVSMCTRVTTDNIEHEVLL